MTLPRIRIGQALYFVPSLLAWALVILYFLTQVAFPPTRFEVAPAKIGWVWRDGSSSPRDCWNREVDGLVTRSQWAYGFMNMRVSHAIAGVLLGHVWPWNEWLIEPGGLLHGSDLRCLRCPSRVADGG